MAPSPDPEPQIVNYKSQTLEIEPGLAPETSNPDPKPRTPKLESDRHPCKIRNLMILVSMCVSWD